MPTPAGLRAYDLIGDIHGCGDELEALLRTMGYAERSGAWRHPERTAIFVGDFLDRGPKIRQTLRTVRAMLEAGSACSILGNHEWNAFAYHFPHPDGEGGFLRPNSAKNRKQHERTLVDVPAAELASHLLFFRSLPFRLDLGALRVVHACWDEVAFGVVDEALARHGGISDDFLIEGSDEESPLFAAIETVLKGKEMRLPEGVSFVDKDGHRRTEARLRWFESPAGRTVANYILPTFSGVPDAPLPAHVVAEARPYPREAPPVFFGHYWLDAPRPELLAPNVVCIDYSVAKQGFLCAYRWEGEHPVDPGRFVTQARLS